MNHFYLYLYMSPFVSLKDFKLQCFPAFIAATVSLSLAFFGVAQYLVEHSEILSDH